MDFVVSKVAMSVCALLVISILSGVLGSTKLVGDASELSGVLGELCGLVDRAVRSCSESVQEWTVPHLSNGDLITITITSGVVRGEAGGYRDAHQTEAPLHTWRYSGEPLNETTTDQLDRAEAPLEAVSGQRVVITTVNVLYENDQAIFAFVAL